jgi:hypothetical protein
MAEEEDAQGPIKSKTRRMNAPEDVRGDERE